MSDFMTPRSCSDRSTKRRQIREDLRPVRTEVPGVGPKAGFAGDPVVPRHDVVMALRTFRNASRASWVANTGSLGVFIDLGATVTRFIAAESLSFRR